MTNGNPTGKPKQTRNKQYKTQHALFDLRPEDWKYLVRFGPPLLHQTTHVNIVNNLERLALTILLCFR